MMNNQKRMTVVEGLFCNLYKIDIVNNISGRYKWNRRDVIEELINSLCDLLQSKHLLKSEQQNIVVFLYHMNKVNSKHTANHSKVKVINSFIQYISSVIAEGVGVPHQMMSNGCWSESFAVMVLNKEASKNKALYLSALNWCREFASGDVKSIIKDAYLVADELQINFDIAFFYIHSKFYLDKAA